MLSVTSTRWLELDWLYRGVGRFFPEAWARFRDFAGLTDAYWLPTDVDPPIAGPLEAYSRMMEDPDLEVLRARRLPRGRRADPRGQQAGRHSRRADPRRNDLGGGACTPWELARGWPGAELIIVGDSGHTGSTSMTDEMHAAPDRRYERITHPA